MIFAGKKRAIVSRNKTADREFLSFVLKMKMRDLMVNECGTVICCVRLIGGGARKFVETAKRKKKKKKIIDPADEI